jgi:hypothetical protein
MKNGVEMVKVPALEFEALVNIENVIRIAMVNPAAAEVIVAALHALDTVRSELGIGTAEQKLSPLMTELLGRVTDIKTQN